MSSDDLARAIPDPSHIPLQAMGYRQGIIVTWNPITLENTVDVGGAILPDLPVLGVAEATTFQPGTKVGLAVVESTWAIIGTFVRPNTAAAAAAVSMLSSRTKTQTIDTQETTSSFPFTDLATVGPEVPVIVGPSGRVLMILSAKGGWSIVPAADLYMGAFMTAALSGANVRAASLVWGAWIETQHTGTTGATVSATIGATYTFESLTPGLTTFTAKYASGVSGTVCDFARRTLTVIAL